ncbi:MAG TPA: L-threonylcarbamoyladenylate synthase [Dehalococcoidia bacterium]|nr:L-threonylcarbamoyladenylate synthase [Dehalococcoidia bacterium]
MHENEQYHRAIDVLRQGGIVALPTDTVYGLVAVAADRAAVQRVYHAKVRDPAQPMPLFVASIEQAELIADLNDAARVLAGKFWPGALTIVVSKKPDYETRAAAGASTVGLRIPADPFLREAARQLGPLTGTSANIAGREECHTAAQVRAQLAGAVDLIVDAPVAASGTPSTVVDCSRPGGVRILREGTVSRAALAAALAGVAVLEA